MSWDSQRPRAPFNLSAATAGRLRKIAERRQEEQAAQPDRGEAQQLTTSPAMEPSQAAGVSRKGSALDFAIIEGWARAAPSSGAEPANERVAEESASMAVFYLE